MLAEQHIYNKKKRKKTHTHTKKKKKKKKKKKQKAMRESFLSVGQIALITA